MTKIRRVPLNFDWPLNKVWGGFIMPDTLRLPPCPDCNHEGFRSSGYSVQAWAIMATFYALDVPEPMRNQIAWHDKITQREVDHLLKKDRLRTLVYDDAGKHEWVSQPLTAAEVNARQARMGLDSHDSSNQHILVQFRCKRLGIDLLCATCEGRTTLGTPEQKAAHKAWKPTRIPKGKGWQAWEDVSEGSPISAVFETREGIVHWFTTEDSIWGVRRTPLTRAQAEALVGTGTSVGSFVTVNNTLVDGDKAVAGLSDGS